MKQFQSMGAVAMVFAVVISWPLGYWIQQSYLSAPMIVGGSVCETNIVNGQQIASCFGYPPVGVVILAVLLAVVINAVLAGAKRATEVVK